VPLQPAKPVQEILAAHKEENASANVSKTPVQIGSSAKRSTPKSTGSLRQKTMDDFGATPKKKETVPKKVTTLPESSDDSSQSQSSEQPEVEKRTSSISTKGSDRKSQLSKARCKDKENTPSSTDKPSTNSLLKHSNRDSYVSAYAVAALEGSSDGEDKVYLSPKRSLESAFSQAKTSAGRGDKSRKRAKAPPPQQAPKPEDVIEILSDSDSEQETTKVRKKTSIVI
jgi:hypothetical protein